MRRHIDQLNPTLAASAGSKLLMVSKSKGLIAYSAGTGHALGPIAATNNTPFIALTLDGTLGQKYATTFVNWTPPAEEAKLMATELNARGIKSLAWIGLKHQGCEALREALLPELSSQGITVTGTEIYTHGERDFRIRLNKLLAQKPDIILAEAFSPDIDIILKQLTALAPQQAATTFEAFEYIANKKLTEGRWHVTAAVGDERFVERFTKRFGKRPFTGAPLVYDSVMIMADAINSKQDPNAWLAAQKSHQGVSGETVFGGDRVLRTKAALMAMKDGVWVRK